MVSTSIFFWRFFSSRYDYLFLFSSSRKDYEFDSTIKIDLEEGSDFEHNENQGRTKKSYFQCRRYN